MSFINEKINFIESDPNNGLLFVCGINTVIVYDISKINQSTPIIQIK